MGSEILDALCTITGVRCAVAAVVVVESCLSYTCSTGCYVF